MPVSIRPHHLLCMLTYLGKGYTPDFVSNYTRIIRRLNEGETLNLISGPDDICQPMLKEPDCHCHNDSIAERDRVCLQEIGALLVGEPLTLAPLKLTQDQLVDLRSAFRNGGIRTACHGCEWFDLCTNIAQDDFGGCRFQLPPN